MYCDKQGDTHVSLHPFTSCVIRHVVIDSVFLLSMHQNSTYWINKFIEHGVSMWKFITPNEGEGGPRKGPRVNTLIINVESMGCYLKKKKKTLYWN